jgi:hypothetical protein
MRLNMDKTSFDAVIEKYVKKYVNYAKQFDSTAPNNNWYVGITNDLKKRKSEHENQKNITCKYFESFFKGTREEARKLEKALADIKFANTTDGLKIKGSPAVVESEGSSAEKIDEKVCHVYVYLAVEKKQKGSNPITGNSDWSSPEGALKLLEKCFWWKKSNDTRPTTNTTAEII